MPCIPVANRSLAVESHNNGGAIGLVVFFILVYSSLRGWIILIFNIPVGIVYGASSLFLVCLSIYGFLIRSRFVGNAFSRFRSLLLVNLFFGIYFVLSDILLRRVIDFSYVYVFLLPYIVFVFLRVPVRWTYAALYIISIGLALSVFDNYFHTVVQKAGRDYLLEYNARLRPDIATVISTTGNYSRLGGCTGSYHDSANILGMLGSYYYVRALVYKSLRTFAMGLLVFVPMIMSHSATNIVIFILTVFAIMLYLMYTRGGVKTFLFVVSASCLFVSLFVCFPELLGFTVRIGPEGDWHGMFNSLSAGMLVSPFFWIGHGYVFDSEYIKTEVALLKGVFEYGFFNAILVYLVVIYPLFLFLKVRRPVILLPYLAPVVFGFLSLLHYGSLFRSTNIGVFYAMYSLFLLHYVGCRPGSIRQDSNQT